jgi:hypothetical protein
MIELSVDRFVSVQHLFAGCYCIPLNGVVDGQHEGRIFVDNALSPSAVYVWTPWGYHYFAGASSEVSFIESMREMLTDTLQPQSASVGEPDILLTLMPGVKKAPAGDILPTSEVIKIYRSTFAFNEAKFLVIGDWKDRFLKGLSIVRIDENLVSYLVDDICATWRSVEEFFERGFGFCLLENDNILSTCYSAFVARNNVEIAVSTEKDYRRRGYAAITGAVMIEHCLENDLLPHWECFWDNEPSIALANRLGFEKTADVPIYYWEGPSDKYAEKG